MERRGMGMEGEAACRMEGLQGVVGTARKDLHCCQVEDGGAEDGSWQSLRWEANRDDAWGAVEMAGALILPRERALWSRRNACVWRET